MADTTSTQDASGALSTDVTNPHQLVFSDLTTDFNEFKAQMQGWLQTQETWKGTLTTMTSTTLIDLDASLGTFMATRLNRAMQDAYAETALNDNAIRAIAQMQGLRMTRYLPAQILCDIASPYTIAIPPLTQFNIAGKKYFNRNQLNLEGGVSTSVTLYQGEVKSVLITDGGDGSDLQAYISDEDGFTISDQDVMVQINGVTIPKALGGLWNYKNLPAYSDLTMADGRLLIQFGGAGFGSVPQPNDQVLIRYAVTTGANGNDASLQGKEVTVTGFDAITGTALSNSSGGANDKDVIVYKNVASGSLGTYQSAVTKGQYTAVAATYPGIIDAFTQAQREINPRKLEWMNVIRVSALTTSPWTQQQKKDFTDYMQTVTMYAPYFVYVDAVAINRSVDVEVYVFNSADTAKVKKAAEQELLKLMSPRPGLLMTNIYPSDIVSACKRAAPGMVSYVIINRPQGAFIVTAPDSPMANYTIIDGGGTLGQQVYAYSISTTVQLYDEYGNPSGTEEGPASTWVFPQVTNPIPSSQITLTWPAVENAVQYKVWGRTGTAAGLMATLPATTRTFTDNGSIVPDPQQPPNTFAEVPVRYNYLPPSNLTVAVKYAERQLKLEANEPIRKIIE